MRITGLHHVTPSPRPRRAPRPSTATCSGLALVSRAPTTTTPTPATSGSATPRARPARSLSFLEYPQMAEGSVGRGSTHHVALAVDSAEEELCVARLPARPRRPDAPRSSSAARFRSLYLRDPDGHILEIATRADRRRARRAAGRRGQAHRGDGRRWAHLLPGGRAPRAARPAPGAGARSASRSSSSPTCGSSARNLRQRVPAPAPLAHQQVGIVMLSASHGRLEHDVGRRDLTLRDAALELRAGEADLVGTLQGPAGAAAPGRSSLTRSSALPAASALRPDRLRRVRGRVTARRTGKARPRAGLTAKPSPSESAPSTASPGTLLSPCVAPDAIARYDARGGRVNPRTAGTCARSALFVRDHLDTGVERSPISAAVGSGPCSASNAALTAANASSARSSVGPVVGRHDARAQQRAARRDRRVDRDVDVDARLVERLPQQRGLPVVADEHRHDRDDRASSPAARRLDDLEAELAQPVAQVARVVEHAGEQLAAPRRERQMRSAASAAPIAAGTAGGGEQERRDWIRRNSITSAGRR